MFNSFSEFFGHIILGEWTTTVFYVLVLFIAGSISYCLWEYSHDNYISGVFKIPGYPIVGNLFQVINNPAQVFMKWSEVFNVSLFQIRFGSRSVVVVNSFEDVTRLWIKYSCSNNSRPVSYTFHQVVSSTRGFTVGSTPAGESYKRKRKSISQHLNHRAVERSKSTLDKEVEYMINQMISRNHELSGPPSVNMFRNSKCELADIDMKIYFQQFALRSSVFFAFGIHLDCFGKDSKLCNEIIEVESAIMKFRSPIANLEDFLPILRYFPGKFKKAAEFRERRDRYMNKLYKTMIEGIVVGNADAVASIVGTIKIEQDQQMNKLTEEEIQSICLTLVSAGLDNTALNINHLMGHFSQPFYGAALQKKAYDALLAGSNGDICQAWDDAVDVKCPYVIALVQESLRYFTVLPLGLPRITTKDIVYNGAFIPKETILIMNAFAANHDSCVFQSPYEFIPERWLDAETGELIDKHDLIHLSFGAGSRMCAGIQLAINEMYTFTSRLVLYFKIKPPTCGAIMDLDPFRNNENPSATSFEPKPFKVRLEPRYSDSLYNKLRRS
ncbi:hypothetical protein G9P44_005700 [Scheffersomyces stipitis]|nr:hypothetical protein G9P44_005700 [Scheffersomyces stipitis]